jgi:iron complex transport system substrate-binding protein
MATRTILNRTASRRTAIGGTIAGLSALALSRGAGLAQATPGATPSGADGVQADGSWAFTDDRGITLTAPEVPSQIVAQTTAAASLYDFGVEIAGIYGPSKSADGVVDFQAGNLDLDAIEVLGDYGSDSLEMDIEKFVTLDPDLVVDMVIYEDTFWYLVGDARARVEELGVPIVGIDMGTASLLQIIQRFEELAGALGADLNTPEIAAAKEMHAASEAALEAAIEAKPELSLVCISPTVETVWVASPRYMNDLRYFADLGLIVVDHDADDWFKQISWEEIINYSADVILVDARPGNPTPEELAEAVPLWNSLPAVQAGQIGPWYAGAPSSYSRLAPIMDELTALLEAADPGVV